MADIVEKLGAARDYLDGGYVENGNEILDNDCARTCEEAITEIERLRTPLQWALDYLTTEWGYVHSNTMEHYWLTCAREALHKERHG